MLDKDLRTHNKSNYPQTKGRKELLKSEKKSDLKILIIGDSHAKKCAAELRHNLDSRYVVSGFIKPRATTSEIIRTAEDEISTLKSNDVVILWAGANDISRDNTKEALKSLSKFMNVNILIINSPHRHDLMLASCVNSEVFKFNRQIKKIVKLHTNVELLEVELQRKHFTRHGQHLNNGGKELIDIEMAKTVEVF
jgi:lysophospholipase L1-like esterase